MSAPPQFCPFCGTPIAFKPHEHEPRYALLAEQARGRGVKLPSLPERIESLLAGESWAAACPGCRTISHVVGHRSP